MAVNLTRISDLETRNRDHQFTGVVANGAAASDCFPQIVRPNQPTSNHQIHHNHRFLAELVVISSTMFGVVRFFSEHYEMAQGVLLDWWMEMTPAQR
jgi:hypothetical protein